MSCPVKENKQCCKKMTKCIVGVFLAILVSAILLKIIVIILNILPGSNYGNAWLVVIAAIMVILAATKYRRGNKCCCGPECNCPCHDETHKQCCNNKPKKTEGDSEKTE